MVLGDLIFRSFGGLGNPSKPHKRYTSFFQGSHYVLHASRDGGLVYGEVAEHHDSPLALANAIVMLARCRMMLATDQRCSQDDVRNVFNFFGLG